MKKRIIAYITYTLAVCCMLCACRRDEADKTKRLKDLGIPLIETYTNETEQEIRARRSEDMVIYDGRLYVGCGDYDTNMGPVSVVCYDISEGEWQISPEVLEDEQIKRFLVLDGTLCIPGTDPRGDWSMGNYYTLSDGGWQTQRVLPSGIHCFDGLIFEGRTFFGLGVNSGDYPVAVSDGEGFRSVAFMRDGELVDTSAFEFVRTYNLTVWQDQLFAFLTLGNTDSIAYEVYRYDGESFVYYSTPPEVFWRGYDMAHTGAFADLGVFINGYCYFTTEDMVSFRPRQVGDSDLACDMLVLEDTLYVLAYRELEKGYESAVYATRDGKTFEKLFYFQKEIPAGAFAYENGVFYFSMGRYYDAESHEMGRVFSLPFSLD